MAASMLPAGLYREYFCCPVCGDSYQDPRVLPCSHTFCRGCLEDHVSRTTTSKAALWFLCPTCRDIITLPNRGVTAFTTNGFVQGLAGRLDSLAKEGQGRGSRAVGEGHRQGGGSRIVGEEQRGGKGSRTVEEDSGVDSVVSSVECLSVASCDVTAKQYCTGEGGCNEKVTNASPQKDNLATTCQCDVNPRIYCLDCDRMLCVPCLSGTDHHKYHRICELRDKADTHRNNFQSNLHHIKKDILSLRRGVTNLGRYKRDLDRRKETVIQDIRQRAEDMRDMVSGIERRLVSETEAVTLAEVNRADIQAQHNQSSASTLDSLASLVSKLLKKGTDQQVVQLDEVLGSFAEDTEKHITRNEEYYLLERPLIVQFTSSNDDDTNKSLKQTFGKVWQERHLLCPESTEVMPAYAATITPPRELFNTISARDLGLSQGHLVQSFSLFTEGSTSVPYPTSLCFLENGDLLVVDQGNKCVKFYREGAVYKKIYGSESLFGVAQLPDGNIAITDHSLHIFDQKGRLVKVLRHQPRDCRGVSVANEERVVVCDNTSRCVYLLSSDTGTVQHVIIHRQGGQPFHAPHYVATGPNNETIISDMASNCVVILDGAHQVTGVLDSISGQSSSGSFSLQEPLGVCVDRMGVILVCDSMNHRILAADLHGRYLCTVVEGRENIAFPQAVAIGPDAQLHVAERGGTIKVFTYHS